MRDKPVLILSPVSRTPETFGDHVRDMIESFVDKYPWAAFLLVWLLWVGGTLWEYRIHRSKQVTAGWLLLLFGVLGYAASQATALGAARWALVAIALLTGWAVIRRILRDKDPGQTVGKS